MRIFVTGAAGFLGTAVTSAALAAGHSVTSLVRRRPPAGAPWDHPRVTVLVGDLRRPASWAAAAAGADAVIHLAAVTSGSIHEQFAGTVVTTEGLLRVLAGLDHPPRLVHTSTFSVYDYGAVPLGGRLDEDTPLEDEPAGRGAYCESKLAQERLVRRYADDTGAAVVVLRPGAVWGAGAWWDGGLAVAGRRWGLAFGPGSAMKSVYVENCAEAIVLAATEPAAVGQTLNVVDDPQPTQREFHAAVRSAGVDVPRAIPVPYRMARLFTWVVGVVDRVVFGGRLRSPEFADAPRMAARYKPLRYPNERCRRVLQWRPRFDLDEAAARAAAADPDVAVGGGDG